MTTARDNTKCDTLVSLRDHIEARLEAQQLAVDTARRLMEARMEGTERILEARLDGLNHLRESVLSKGEFLGQHAALTAEFHAEAAGLRAEVAGLKEWKAEQSGKASTQSVYISYVIAIIGVILSAAALLHEMITP